jgi:hypothetical protein
LNGCTSPDEATEPFTGPFGQIEAGSTDNAYSKIVNDTVGIAVNYGPFISSDSKQYDIDNDGTNDISINTIGGGDNDDAWGMNTHILPLDSNELIVQTCKNTSDKDEYTPLSLRFNAVINSESNYMDYTSGTYGFSTTFNGSSGSTNCWGNHDFKYIGIKLVKGSAITYAWVKLSIHILEKETQIIVDSYASRK